MERLKVSRLGLTGLAGAGKNAVADILTRLYGYKQVSFAEPLRREASKVTLYGVHHIPAEMWARIGEPAIKELIDLLRDPEVLGLDPWLKPTPPKMRGILQLWGTEFRRAVSPNYWVDKAGEMMDSEPGDFVATDTRFPNECGKMQEIWHITRPGLVPLKHVSESQITPDMCAYFIDNDGDLAKLEESVKAAEARLLAGPSLV